MAGLPDARRPGAKAPGGQTETRPLAPRLAMHRASALLKGRSAAAAPLLIAAYSDQSQLAPQADTGPAPTLVSPVSTLVPTVHIAPARGWVDAETPEPAAGLRVNAFAKGLQNPRWLLMLPNGDVLVAEMNAPPTKIERLRDWVMNKVMTHAGARAPSADRIGLLGDGNGNGVAEQRSVWIALIRSFLRSPQILPHRFRT